MGGGWQNNHNRLKRTLQSFSDEEEGVECLGFHEPEILLEGGHWWLSGGWKGKEFSL